MRSPFPYSNYNLQGHIYLLLFFKSYLIGCSVSIERNAHLVVALVLAGESDACSQRYLHSSQVSY